MTGGLSAGNTTSEADRPVKVWLVCTGVGVYNRGIESFARDCFDGLYGYPGLDLTLFKGAGKDAPGERVLWNLPRTGKMAALLGKAIRRNSYVVEQLTSFLPLARLIRRERPDVIFTSEANLRFQLYSWRRRIGVPFKILYSNGGPTHPPFTKTDFVHQVAPLYLEEALLAGEPKDRHFLVPYGIRVPEGIPESGVASKHVARTKLGLPSVRPIVLSVGWIAATHKRMDYVIREVAAMPAPRPFLMMLGNMNEASPPILALADQLLGKEGYAARSVPYGEVQEYYATADVFTLGSVKEGFGRVYLEALIGGLPCAVHDHPLMRYVLGDEGAYGDFTKPGELAELLNGLLTAPVDPEAPARRRASVRSRFAWSVLAPKYLEMFRACRGG